MRISPVLPPLPALRAFEAVARLLSFRKAGEELLITQSAVSHHIRQLEQALGASLFIRQPRGIALTPAGQRYFAATTRAFALLADATAELRAETGDGIVRISLLPSFAANWLVARLGEFHAAHPGIRLQLDPTLRQVDLEAHDADLAIRYGDGNWGGVEARLLKIEELTPIASPQLLRDRPAVTQPRDLLEYPLILTKNPTDWEVWASAAGLDLAAATTLQLTDYNIAIQAAIDGQGIAIGRLLLVQDPLRSGRLVRPLPQVATSPRTAYWLLSPRHRIPPGAMAFARWLAAQMGAVPDAPAVTSPARRPGSRSPASPGRTPAEPNLEQRPAPRSTTDR